MCPCEYVQGTVVCFGVYCVCLCLCACLCDIGTYTIACIRCLLCACVHVPMLTPWPKVA